LRRTVSERTVAELTEIMEGVVERGTAKSAQIPGYTIAGKTGTAAKLINGRYSRSEYNASFIGFIPSRDPALTIIVVIDSPHGNGYTGGVVAAPVFKRIAEAALRQIGVGPNIGAPSPVLVARHDQDSTLIVPQKIGDSSAYTHDVVQAADPGTMPDLQGLSAREALRVLMRLGVTARMAGDGFVIDHRPLPGEPIVRGDIAKLKLARRPPAVPAWGPR
jgi:membrane peptidoglycan carboxypeptidase